jgi:hypothetical protein
VKVKKNRELIIYMTTEETSNNVEVSNGRRYTKKNKENVGRSTRAPIIRRGKALLYKMCHKSGSIDNIGV